MRPVLGRRIISAPSISKNFPTSTAHSFVLSMSLPHGVLDSVFLKKENKKAKKNSAQIDCRMFAVLNMWNYKRDEARRHVDDMKDDSNTMVQVILSLCVLVHVYAFLFFDSSSRVIAARAPSCYFPPCVPKGSSRTFNSYHTLMLQQ